MYVYELISLGACSKRYPERQVVDAVQFWLKVGFEVRPTKSLQAPAMRAGADRVRQNAGPDSQSGDGEELHALQRIATKVRFARNRTIFNDGDDADHAYRIVSGVVRLCKHTVQGRRLVTHFLMPGDYFGFMQLVAYSFTAEAVSDVAAISYPQRQIESLSEQDPSVRRKFRSLLMKQLQGTQDHLLLLGCLSAEERLASFLLWLSERIGATETFVDVPMSRQDIADYLGLTVETVCRTLSKLKRAGVVDLPRSNQLVQNLGSLRAFQNSCEERRAAPGPPDAPAAALADIR